RNFEELQGLVSHGVAVIGVVKANAYGLGAVEVSQTLEKAGAAMLAVTRLEEAIPLRQAGVGAPILMLAPALPDEVDDVVANDLTACVGRYEDARLLSIAAQKQQKQIKVHLKVNTGMNRFGVPAETAIETARHLLEMP